MNRTQLASNVVSAAHAHFAWFLQEGSFGRTDSELCAALGTGNSPAAKFVLAVAELRCGAESATQLARRVVLAANEAFEANLGDGPYSFSDADLIRRNCCGCTNTLSILTGAVAEWRAAHQLSRDHRGAS